MQLGTSYLESVKTGFISHVYVRPESRGKRVGHALGEGLEQWFREKGLATIELQVIIGNIEALEFWKARGYMDDLVQVRKAIAPCKA
jgi:GNAT superfamily N-acetyltransferase